MEKVKRERKNAANRQNETGDQNYYKVTQEIDDDDNKVEEINLEESSGGECNINENNESSNVGSNSSSWRIFEEEETQKDVDDEKNENETIVLEEKLQNREHVIEKQKEEIWILREQVKSVKKDFKDTETLKDSKMKEHKQKTEEDFCDNVANAHFKNLELIDKVNQYEKGIQRFISKEVKLSKKIEILKKGEPMDGDRSNMQRAERITTSKWSM